MAYFGQYPLFDGARLELREHVQRAANAPLRGPAAPLPAGGLFDDDAKAQADLFGHNQA